MEVSTTTSSTTGSFTTGGSSTLSATGSAVAPGRGTDASGVVGSGILVFGTDGVGSEGAADGFGTTGTLADPAVRLARVGIGSAWPATSSAASSSSATAKSEEVFASGCARNDSMPSRYRETSPCPPVA